MSRRHPAAGLTEHGLTAADDHRWNCILCDGPTTATFEVCARCDEWVTGVYADADLDAVVDHSFTTPVTDLDDDVVLLLTHLTKVITECMQETNTTTTT